MSCTVSVCPIHLCANTPTTRLIVVFSIKLQTVYTFTRCNIQQQPRNGNTLDKFKYFHVLLQARFKLEEDWQKRAVFQQMGILWRSSKSKLVRKINKAETEEERLNLKPANIKSMIEWRKFVKAKTSMEFKVT